MSENERQNERDEQNQVEDLEVSEQDAAEVKGGRMADPCEGGE